MDRCFPSFTGITHLNLIKCCISSIGLEMGRISNSIACGQAHEKIDILNQRPGSSHV